MTIFETRPAKLYDVGRMARRLRTEHRESIDRIGADIHTELHNCFIRSPSYRFVWQINGETAALYGVISTLMSPIVYGWAAFTNVVKKYPKATIIEFQRIHDEIMATHNEILTTIIGGDEASLRFLVYLGYHCEHGGPGEPAYTAQGRHDLMKYLRENPDIRRPVGNGYAIALGYHRQAA